MSIKDLQKKSGVELQKELTEKRESLRKLRFGLSGSNTRNTKETTTIKKDIARIMTVLNTPTK